MPESDMSHILVVSPEEAGQKVLQFLQRRLALPPTLLHRWIRTGQIRCNGGRIKPFTRVAVGEGVRLPPFALRMNAAVGQGQPDAVVAALPPLIHADAELLVFNKPAGLPVHTGTGHERDSLATRLAVHYAHAPFAPTPAHRLDKDTSGLLLVAASYRMLRVVQDALSQQDAGEDAGTLHKEYLAWVMGHWPHEGALLLRHRLAKIYEGSDEKVRVHTPQETSGGFRSAPVREAVCVVACLRQEPGRSLMHIRLLTGRTHQIRVQMAEMGYPLCGDVKYGGQRGGPLRLHALRLILPDRREFTVPPPWEGAFAFTVGGVMVLPVPLPNLSV